MDKDEIQSLCNHLLDRFMAALSAHDSAAMGAWHHSASDHKRIN